MTAPASVSESELEKVSHDLGAEIPSGAVRRGWNIRNLTVGFLNGSPLWALTLVGPCSVFVDRKQMIGHDAKYVVHVEATSLGEAMAETPAQLTDIVRQWVSALGLRDLK